MPLYAAVLYVGAAARRAQIQRCRSDETQSDARIYLLLPADLVEGGASKAMGSGFGSRSPKRHLKLRR